MGKEIILRFGRRNVHITGCFLEYKHRTIDSIHSYIRNCLFVFFKIRLLALLTQKKFPESFPDCNICMWGELLRIRIVQENSVILYLMWITINFVYENLHVWAI